MTSCATADLSRPDVPSAFRESKSEFLSICVFCPADDRPERGTQSEIDDSAFGLHHRLDRVGKPQISESYEAALRRVVEDANTHIASSWLYPYVAAIDRECVEVDGARRPVDSGNEVTEHTFYRLRDGLDLVQVIDATNYFCWPKDSEEDGSIGERMHYWACIRELRPMSPKKAEKLRSAALRDTQGMHVSCSAGEYTRAEVWTSIAVAFDISVYPSETLRHWSFHPTEREAVRAVGRWLVDTEERGLEANEPFNLLPSKVFKPRRDLPHAIRLGALESGDDLRQLAQELAPSLVNVEFRVARLGVSERIGARTKSAAKRRRV